MGAQSPAMESLSDLERAVLNVIAHQVSKSTSLLLLQQREVEVIARENTGAGFYTTFYVSSAVTTINAKSPVGDVGATIVGLEHGMGFLLWLKDSRLDQIEGFSFDESTSASISSE